MLKIYKKHTHKENELWNSQHKIIKSHKWPVLPKIMLKPRINSIHNCPFDLIVFTSVLLIHDKPLLWFCCIAFDVEALWVDEVAPEATNVTLESSGSWTQCRAANTPRRYMFKGKSNLKSLYWWAAVDVCLQIPHTTWFVLRRDERMQFSHTECPQCRIRGQRKPRGCSGSETTMQNVILQTL